MKEITTMERLQMKVTAGYGAVLKFGNRVLVTDAHWKGFTAAVYEFIESPEEAGVGDIECRLQLIRKADQTFPDGGHAIAWCMAQK